MLTAAERVELCAGVNLPELIASRGFTVTDKGNGRYLTNLRGEKTASCHIYATSRRGSSSYHDFGTGKGGDALSFLVDVTGMAFADAVAELRRLAGVSSFTSQSQPQEQPQKEKFIPRLRGASKEEMRAVAELRGLPLEAVAWADAVGSLKVGWMFERHHWFLVGNGYVQARRFDGGPFLHGRTKHVLATGKHGGITIAAGRPWHLIAEGLSGVLDILGLIALTRGVLGVGLFSITGTFNANCKWAGTMLDSVRGSRVIILPDTDTTGQAAAEDWVSRLTGHAADVHIIKPPSPHKDWGEAIRDSHAFAAAEFVHHFLKISNH